MYSTRCWIYSMCRPNGENPNSTFQWKKSKQLKNPLITNFQKWWSSEGKHEPTDWHERPNHTGPNPAPILFYKKRWIFSYNIPIYFLFGILIGFINDTILFLSKKFAIYLYRRIAKMYFKIRPVHLFSVSVW